MKLELKILLVQLLLLVSQLSLKNLNANVTIHIFNATNNWTKMLQELQTIISSTQKK